MNDRAAITMKYLLTLILGAVLLVLIIYGVQTKGFGPLWDNIEGRYDEALIFLGFRDDGTPACEDAFLQDIDDMSGKFYPCEEYCTFELVSPVSLLGFSNFSIDKDGFAAVSENDVKNYNKAYSFDILEAQRHKDAYDVLNETVDEYLKESGMGEDAFIDAMEYDKDQALIFKVEWYTLIVRKHIVFYEYSRGPDGEFRWKEVEEQGDSFRILGEVNEDEVFSKVSSAYKEGGAYWRDRRIAGKSTDEFMAGRVNREGFEDWFYDSKERFEAKRLNGENNMWNFMIDEVGDISDYSYLWNGKNWRGLINKKPVDHNEEKIIGVLYEAYEKDKKAEKVSWWYDSAVMNDKYRVVLDSNIEEEIVKMKEKEFRGWFDGIRNSFEKGMTSNSDLVSDLNKFLKKRGEVDVLDEAVLMRVNNKLVGDQSFAEIFFSLPSNREGFGVYYKGGKGVLTYNGEKSIVSDFVGLPDDEWLEFVKINNIYEYFKLRRCKTNEAG